MAFISLDAIMLMELLTFIGMAAPRGDILALVSMYRAALIQCMSAATWQRGLFAHTHTHTHTGTITFFSVCSISWHIFTSLASVFSSLSRNMAGGHETWAPMISLARLGRSLPRTVNTLVPVDREPDPQLSTLGLDKDPECIRAPEINASL